MKENEQCLLCGRQQAKLYMWSCHRNHKFCEECIVDYLSWKISIFKQKSFNSLKIGEQFPCPRLACSQFFIWPQGQEPSAQFKHICYRVSNELQQRKYNLQIYRRSVKRIHYSSCMKPQCGGNIQIVDRLKAQCLKCRTIYCQNCLEIHQGQCNKYRKSQMIKYEQRVCSRCQNHLKQNNSSEQITCHSQYCFRCGQPWNNSTRAHQDGQFQDCHRCQFQTTIPYCERGGFDPYRCCDDKLCCCVNFCLKITLKILIFIINFLGMSGVLMIGLVFLIEIIVRWIGESINFLRQFKCGYLILWLILFPVCLIGGFHRLILYGACNSTKKIKILEPVVQSWLTLFTL